MIDKKRQERITLLILAVKAAEATAHALGLEEPCGWTPENINKLAERFGDDDFRVLALQTVFKAREYNIQGFRNPPQKAAIPASLRWQVWERDNYTCKHCGSRRFLSVDHIIPESKGGEMVIANLQTLCRPCNSQKGAA